MNIIRHLNGFSNNKMRRLRVFLYILVILLHIFACHGLQDISLSEYGPIDNKNICQTFEKVISDLNGKRLFLPDEPIDIGDIVIIGKTHFAIVGSKKYPITCKNFSISDCKDFDLSYLFLKGTKAKFATFDIIGDSENFRIHDCLFDSEKDNEGHNTFYGIHVITDTQKQNFGYSNSPRHFRIDRNEVRNTRYDGILAHAYCSDFVIEKNKVVGAECIGVEVEGRLGGAQNTTVHPCRNAIIRNNIMNNCGGWGVLLMWVENAEVKNNVSLNAFGPFLSIGCKYLKVKNNIFEGSGKGFEMSQEFYKVSNGINEHVVVSGNTIKGFPRAWDRGLLDIRHARDIIVKRNKFVSVDREQSCYISVSSSQNITISDNEFKPTTYPLETTIKINDVKDPETGDDVEELNTQNIMIRKNIYINIPYKLDKGKLDLLKREIVIQ